MTGDLEMELMTNLSYNLDIYSFIIKYLWRPSEVIGTVRHAERTAGAFRQAGSNQTIA